NSKFLLGLVAAIGSAPMAFSSIWGGALADLYPKRSILVATQSAQMLCAFLLATGVWLGFASTGFIMLVAALNGISMGFDMPARQAFSVEMTSREDLLNAISLNSSIVNGARDRAVRCGINDRRCRRGDVFFSERTQFYRSDRRFPADAPAAF